MRDALNSVYQAYDKYENQLAHKSAQFDFKKVESLLSGIYSPGPSFIYVFDFREKRFDFLSDSIVELFGLSSADATPETLIKIIHPEDLGFYVAAEGVVTKYLFEVIPKEDQPFYKASYMFRLGNPSANVPYKMYLHQGFCIAFDEEGNIERALGVQSDISHLTKVNHKKMSMIGINGRPPYYNIDPFADNHIPQQVDETIRFTNREKEILRFLAEGMISKEIAEHLYLSIDTVRTHRRNILSKYGFKSTSHAVAYSIKNGLI